MSVSLPGKVYHLFDITIRSQKMRTFIVSIMGADALFCALRSGRNACWTAELLSIQLGVETSPLKKQGVGAALDDAPGIDHQNLISSQNSRKAMCDGHGGSTRLQLLKCCLDQAFGLGVQRARRLIQNED